MKNRASKLHNLMTNEIVSPFANTGIYICIAVDRMWNSSSYTCIFD